MVIGLEPREWREAKEMRPAIILGPIQHYGMRIIALRLCQFF